MSSSLETMVNGLSNNGMKVDFQKRLDDGTLFNATEKDMSLLTSKSIIANAAQDMFHLSKNDKLKKALGMKADGNSH